MRHLRLLLFVACSFVPAVTALSAEPDMSAFSIPSLSGQVMPVAGWTCSRASNCAEAVRAWCGGYRRADGDSDGIPCENVCRSRAEVRRIRQQIGC